MHAIVAEGANDMRIPVIFFETREQAENLMECLAAKPMKLEQTAPGGGYVAIPDPTKTSYLTTKGGPGKPEDGFVDLDDDEVIEAIFLDYYGGCGEVYSLDIVEITTGKPMFGWDLD